MLVIDHDHQVICIDFVLEREGIQIQVPNYISSSIYTLNKAGLIGEP
jgi:hypothetical protein